MQFESNTVLAAFSFLVGVIALFVSTRMSAYQRHEYQFFLQEHREKLGTEPSTWAKVVAWNAAMGGRAPKWHWIAPVVSPASTFNR
jgi:hypothetical protein